MQAESDWSQREAVSNLKASIKQDADSYRISILANLFSEASSSATGNYTEFPLSTSNFTVMAPSTRFSAAVAALLISLTTAHPLLPDRTDLSSSTTLLSNFTASNITFGTCPEGFPSAVECATYAVPIDWDNVQGEQFNLSLVRWPANTNSTNKIGTLFINPGGPGGSATAFVAGFAQGALPLPEGLHDAFDIIGLDPRGVGLSNAVTCDETIRAERVSLFPKTQEEYDALVDKNRRYGESCRNLTGSLVEYVDTISAAKASNPNTTASTTLLTGIGP